MYSTNNQSLLQNRQEVEKIDEYSDKFNDQVDELRQKDYKIQEVEKTNSNSQYLKQKQVENFLKEAPKQITDYSGTKFTNFKEQLSQKQQVMKIVPKQTDQKNETKIENFQTNETPKINIQDADISRENQKSNLEIISQVKNQPEFEQNQQNKHTEHQKLTQGEHYQNLQIRKNEPPQIQKEVKEDTKILGKDNREDKVYLTQNEYISEQDNKTNPQDTKKQIKIKEKKELDKVNEFFTEVPKNVFIRQKHSYKNFQFKMGQKVKEKSMEQNKNDLVESLQNKNAQHQEFQENEFKPYQDISEITPNKLIENEITQIKYSKTPYQEQSVETSQIINMISDEKDKSRSKSNKKGQNKYHKLLQDNLQVSRHLNEKERLKRMLEEELHQVSQEIREMRTKKQQHSDRQTARKQLNQKNPLKEAFILQQDQGAIEQAQELVRKMNQFRKEKRVRQQQQYAKIENFMRDKIDKLREDQDRVFFEMEMNRKDRIKKRIHEYNKRQLEFVQLQQVNQEFVKELINNGPQEGNLAKLVDDKVQKIKGEPKRKVILKGGAHIYLPSIRNKQYQNIFSLQKDNDQFGKNKSQKPLHVKLPAIKQNYSVAEQLLQVELERAMIQKYRDSRQDILDSQNINYE